MVSELSLSMKINVDDTLTLYADGDMIIDRTGHKDLLEAKIPPDTQVSDAIRNMKFHRL